LGIPVRRFRYGPGFLETLTHDQAVPERVRDRPVYGALVPAYLAGGVREARRVGREGVDVVHVHWPMPHALFGAAMRRAAGPSTAMVCSFYSVEINWIDHRLPWLRPFLAWTIRSADAVTAISRSTADAVVRIADRDVTIIPYAAVLPSVPEEPSRIPFADPRSPIRILFVGRLVERKGVEVLVRALARLRHWRPAELVVIGTGNREGHIRRTAALEGVSEHVDLRGAVSADELARAYAECDLFVLPAVVDSRGDTEGLGVVLLEALAFERPVIASRAGGIVDIVSDGETGWLVDPGDAEVLARKIQAVADSPEEARRVARRGRRETAERFSWDRILSDTEAVYASAREARRGGS
jgi:glycosyltransferase involved in cell wall biosynthesis